MEFDFDTRIDRSGTNAIKWDMTPEGGVAMWVADMDFATAPAVREAVEKRAAHGIFGYSSVPKEWYEAYQSWWSGRYYYEIDKNWLSFVTGVIPVLSTAVRKFTTPAEKVIVQTPVYNVFFNCIINNGRVVSENELIYEDGKYRMDFDDLEKKMSDKQATMMFLCNPHNPTGNIWSKDDLVRVAELAKKHHVLVVSDEIHCDLTEPQKTYIPYQKVSDEAKYNSIAAIAPSKSFNIAGLNTAAVCVPDEGLRNRMVRAINTDEVAEPNAFAVDAAIAAYTKGGEWIDALRSYVFLNKQAVNAYLANNIPSIKAVGGEATYLMWLDISKLMDNDSEKFGKEIKAFNGLFMNSGYAYGECGRRFMRLNVACPREQVMDAMSRLKEFVNR